MNTAGPFVILSERAPLAGVVDEVADELGVAEVADELGVVEVGEAPLTVEVPGAAEAVLPEGETETVDAAVDSVPGADDSVLGKTEAGRLDSVMGPGPRDGLLTIEKLLLLLLPCARTLPDMMARMKKT